MPKKKKKKEKETITCPTCNGDGEFLDAICNRCDGYGVIEKKGRWWWPFY